MSNYLKLPNGEKVLVGGTDKKPEKTVEEAKALGKSSGSKATNSSTKGA